MNSIKVTLVATLILFQILFLISQDTITSTAGCVGGIFNLIMPANGETVVSISTLELNSIDVSKLGYQTLAVVVQ